MNAIRRPTRLLKARNMGYVSLVVVVSLCIGCGRSSKSPASIEIQRVKAGDVELVLFATHADVQRKDALTIEFRGPDGQLRDVGDVRGSASMPMAGMAPMLGSFEVKRTDTPGRYQAAIELGMAGGWQITLDWSGSAGKGSARFQQAVR